MKRDDAKYPWFKLFTADWLASLQVRQCSLAARGAWIDLLCLVNSTGTGRLRPTTPGGWTDEALSRLLSGDPGEALSAVRELRAIGILTFDGDGALISERAIREHRIRAVRAESGAKGSQRRWQSDSKPDGKGNGKDIMTSDSVSESCLLPSSGRGSAEGEPSPGRVGTIYGTPEPPGFRDALRGRWDAARAGGLSIGPCSPNCLRMLPGTLDEIANSDDLAPECRADPPAFLLRQLDAYLSSREARAAPLNRLGSFLRQSDGRRKWLEGPDVWNHERKAPDPVAEPTVHDRINASLEKMTNAGT